MRLNSLQLSDITMNLALNPFRLVAHVCAHALDSAAFSSQYSINMTVPVTQNSSSGAAAANELNNNQHRANGVLSQLVTYNLFAPGGFTYLGQ
jgi:hypothetical protein